MLPKIIITMPAYHAEGTVAKTVADIPTKVADKLILVDDASTDNTAQIARELEGITVYVHPRNRGYGGNQKTCYAKAIEHGADIIVLLHPDYQYDPKAVPLLIAPILGGYADMTFGSRFAGLSDPRGGGMPRYRYYGNRITTVVENHLLGTRFTEMHSGLRAYTRACLLSLPLQDYSDDFAFDSQLLVDAVTSGQRVVEVPISTRYTKESSSISVLRSLRYVSQSIAYAGACAVKRGRKGRRFPTTYGDTRAPHILRGRQGTLVQKACPLCGRPQMMLVHPSNAPDDIDPSEFACTSDAVAKHDDILQCPDCGMVSSRPTIAPSEIVRNYAEMTDESYLSEHEAREELFRWVLDRIDGFLIPSRRLLEVGSNVGLFLKVAGERGWNAKGIEPSKWAVDLGRQRFGVDLVQGTVDDLDDQPASTDAVVMLDVLEHLSDPVGDLRKLRVVLAEDGLLAVSTIDVSSIHAKVRRGNWPWFIRPHLQYFTPESLEATFKRSGFRMVDWAVVPRRFHLSYLAERAGRSMGAVGKVAHGVSQVVNPRLPMGWLGDVVFAIGRPIPGPTLEGDPQSKHDRLATRPETSRA
jgi:SAM-dependent methyltransferase